MPRGKRVPAAKQDASINEAINSFATHHILTIRRGRGGEILAIKHVTYGWMSPKEYYGLQKVHEVLNSNLLGEFVRGGYQLKAWLWGSSIQLDVIASGFEIPIGLIIAGLGFELYAVDAILAADKQVPVWYPWLDLAALILPFGELWYIYRLYGIVSPVVDWFLKELGNLSGATGIPEWLYLVDAPAAEFLAAAGYVISGLAGTLGTGPPFTTGPGGPLPGGVHPK